VSWQRNLARPVAYTKPKRGKLRTLAGARAYAIRRAATGRAAAPPTKPRNCRRLMLAPEAKDKASYWFR